MTPCPACGFPAAPTAGRCAFCDRPLGAPRVLRVERAAGGFCVLEAGEPFAHARVLEGVLVLDPLGAQGGASRLVPVRTPSGPGVALLDGELEPLGVVVADPGAPWRARFLDPAGREVLSFRDDGPTGLHAIDAHGRVELLASLDKASPAPALDLLLVAPGDGAHVAVLLGVVVALWVASEERLGLVA